MKINFNPQDIYDEYDGKVADAIISAIEGIKDRAVLRDIERAIEDGDFDQVAEILEINEKTFSEYAALFLLAFGASSQAIKSMANYRKMFAKIDIQFGGGINFPGGYDMLSKSLDDIKRKNKEQIIQFITNGLNAGDGPYEVARQLAGRYDPKTGKRVGGVIGLSEDLLNTYMRAKANLSTPEGLREFLRLGSRDKRLDAMIKRAIAANRGLNKTEAQKVLARLYGKLLLIRAKRIARTEMSNVALGAGYYAVLEGAIKSGKLETTFKQWRDVGDRNVRHSHKTLGGTIVRIDQPFLSRGGLMLYPSDRSLGASASEVVNCRCYIQYIGAA